MRRPLVALVALLLALAWLPGRAAAADLLDTSTPIEHAELDRAPGWVTLVFTYPVDPNVAKIVVLDSRGRNVAKNGIIVENTNVTMQLQDDLAKDTYTVMYRVDGPDGDIAGGSFQFAYGKGAWTDAGKTTWNGASAEPSVLSDPDPVPRGTGTAATAPPPTTPDQNGEETKAGTPPATEASQVASGDGSRSDPTARPTTTASTAPAGSGSSVAPWIALGAAVVAGLGALGFVLSRRRGAHEG